MGSLIESVERSIITRRLFRHGQRILLAVSGGLDSMVLLHLFHALSKKHGWRLAVAHLNHQLRGRSSDADEKLVLRAAKALRLRVVSKRVQVRALARSDKLSIEMAARKLRHQFLAQTAARLKTSAIALAHHADDQLEHFWLRLLRGGGGEGLAGMKWRNPSPADSSIELVRPLLDQPKQVLRNYAIRNGIHFREDASNASLDIQRNRIRHELLPLLRKRYQPALARTLSRAMDILAADSDFVTQTASAWLAMVQAPPAAPHSATNFAALALAVQRRCIHLQLLQHGITPDFELVERLRLNGGKPANLPGPGLKQVVRDDCGLLHLRKKAKRVLAASPRSVSLRKFLGELVFDGVQLSWQIESKRGSKRPNLGLGHEFFDADKVGTPIVLRHWLPGDKFQPIGMAQSLKLQDFFTNQKVPRSRRHELLLALTAKGEIFWVEGMRISEQFKLSKSTIRRLQWGWRRL